uniref:Transporter n=1 Tax=Parastrongyloides trichosuri TaxID=131310 RepID=A0A0N5A441_PARTI
MKSRKNIKIKQKNYPISLDHYEEYYGGNTRIHIHNNLCCFRLFHIKSVGYFIGYLEILSLVILTSYFLTQLIVHGFTNSSLILVPICFIQFCLTIILYQGLKTFNTLLLIISFLGFLGRFIFSIIYLATYFFLSNFLHSGKFIKNRHLIFKYLFFSCNL